MEFQSANLCLVPFSTKLVPVVPLDTPLRNFLMLLFLLRHRIRICPLSSIRSIFEHPNRQEQEKIHRPAGMEKLSRKTLLVCSMENLEDFNHSSIRNNLTSLFQDTKIQMKSSIQPEPFQSNKPNLKVTKDDRLYVQSLIARQCKLWRFEWSKSR